MKYCPKCNAEHSKQGIFCSRQCANSRGPRSEDTKEKQSISNKKYADDNADLVKERAAAATLTRRIKYPAQHRSLCSKCDKILDSKNKSGLCKKHFEESPQKDEYIARRKKYIRMQVYNKWTDSSVWMLSSLEIKFYNKLTETNTKWIKPHYVSYITDDGKSHRYFPDFYLPDLDLYVETKGYFWPSDKAKMDLVKQQNPLLKIDIVFENTIEDYAALSGEVTTPVCETGENGSLP